ncbi:MAG: thiamine phosphate synthase [Ruminococcus sp.]|nr:thiamine phosphate synthase [Ruminococcus sp.]
MRLTREQTLLYAVTDRRWTGRQTLLQQIEAALRGGITMLQLREKDLAPEEFLAEALEVRALCSRYGVPLLINDDVEVALRSGADGVHVGQSDMEAGDVRRIMGDDKIVGVTAKTVEQALAAQAAGADYLGSGAVFGSATKTDTKKLELSDFSRICSAVEIPVVAIGGVCRENISQLFGLGASGAAVVSGIFASEDIEAECKALRELAKKL